MNASIRFLTIIKYSFLILVTVYSFSLQSQNLDIYFEHDQHIPRVQNGQAILQSPEEGLWSIALDWQDEWSSNWHHIAATERMEIGEWQILKGTLEIPEGLWKFQDAYRSEHGRIKCIRRFEWLGEETLEKVTLSVRWKINTIGADAFLPNILYYGNPSGERNGKNRVPFFHGQPGEEAIFEEHRFTMPFAALEWNNGSKYLGAALHSLPSPVPGSHQNDQWWSMGVKVNEKDTELLLYSGPVSYNGSRNRAKALQRKALKYGDTYMRVTPGMVIEKTFYLETYPVARRGTAFQRPIYTSIDIFKPFYTEDLPSLEEIIISKYNFAKSRWIEGDNYAGFNMYPDFAKTRILLGWAGQCEAPGYALQPLAEKLGEEDVIIKMVQRSLDHICTSPVGDVGFPVRYEVDENRWHRPDPVSEGQAMNSMAMAIKTGRNNPKLNTKNWEIFLRKACQVHARRILEPAWKPVNTAEAFYIAPLFLAAELYTESMFSEAALKVSDYYAARHLDMTEPYWGGTLDATCEDKEGAWGAFQGFLAAFEFTNDPKYLQYAQHAGDVVLSYTVVWDIPLPAGRMSDHHFKTRGWTGVSPQNQHLDVYGVVMTPAIYKLGIYTGNEHLKRLAAVMYRSCGQMIDPFGAHGEQLQHTNFAQHGDLSDIYKFRGGYSESWTVFWITAHFLHAAAQFEEMGTEF